MMPDDVTDNDMLCERLVNGLDNELQELLEQGMVNGYRWSSILCPMIWTSLLCTTHSRVLTMYKNWQLEDVRARMRDYMSRMEVHTPLQLIGWSRGHQYALRDNGRNAEDTVRRDLGCFTTYAYLKDYIQ